MVLTLKRWKSRSSPGIEAGAYRVKTHSQFKTAAAGRSRAAAFLSFASGREACSAHAERYGDAGWSSPVARQAHNLKVAGSNPAPATNINISQAFRQAPIRKDGGFCRSKPRICRRNNNTAHTLQQHQLAASKGFDAGQATGCTGKMACVYGSNGRVGTSARRHVGTSACQRGSAGSAAAALAPNELW
jgi:hypothetical protein